MSSPTARVRRASRLAPILVIALADDALAQRLRAGLPAAVRASELRLNEAIREMQIAAKVGQRVALFPVAADHLARVCRARSAACGPERRRLLRLWRATAGRVTSRADAVALIDAFDVLLRERVFLDPSPPRRLARLFGLSPHD